MVNPACRFSPQMLAAVFANPGYRHIQYSVYRSPLGQWVRRERFHSPLTDRYANLAGQPEERVKLLETLFALIKAPTTTGETLENTVEALSDVYFYLLRPGGKLHGEPDIAQQRKSYFIRLKDGLTDPSVPAATRQRLQQELMFGVQDVVHGDWPNRLPTGLTAEQRAVILQMEPLVRLHVPQGAKPPVAIPIRIQKEFKTAVKTGNLIALTQMLRLPAMRELIPDWTRATGPDRFQHKAQDFTLDTHLLRAFQYTRTSEAFKTLTPGEQFRVATAAFFHDIGKRTGPENFHQVGRIAPDPHHPDRSARVVSEILPTLGFTQDEVEDITGLVACHLLIGNMAKPHGDPATPERLTMIADRLQTPSRLKMLRVLTEGDIRAVKRDEPDRSWFTPEVEQRLKQYTTELARYLPAD